MILDKIHGPGDLKTLSIPQLTSLAEEIRAVIIDKVSRTGGHLGSNLGAVELTVALHYVFCSPEDKLVFDVSHQTYTHKILTGHHEFLQLLFYQFFLLLLLLLHLLLHLLPLLLLDLILCVFLHLFLFTFLSLVTLLIFRLVQ